MSKSNVTSLYFSLAWEHRFGIAAICSWLCRLFVESDATMLLYYDPIELFSGVKLPSFDPLLHAHVLGCPVFVLDPRLLDGKKLPKWTPRVWRGPFLGNIPQHSTLVGRILNMSTGSVTPQFHRTLLDHTSFLWIWKLPWSWWSCWWLIGDQWSTYNSGDPKQKVSGAIQNQQILNSLAWNVSHDAF